MAEIIQWCNVNQGFLSAVLSLVAVLAAVGIPAFIAHRQNKIALFEKRFEVLKIVNKVVQFSNEIRNTDDIIEKGAIFTLSIWVNLQRVDFCLYERISFIPDTIQEQAIETRYDIDMDAIIQDCEIMRRQLVLDANLVFQGVPLFPEPLRTGLEQLKIHYASLMLSLLEDYCGSDLSEQTKTDLKEFLHISEKFMIGHEYERMMVKLIKI